jgi:uroporphyrinogen decarboxylase
MNHRQRLEACLSGKPIDRVPVSLWRHFPVDDQLPDTLARSVLLFQQTYDFDFVKLTPASSFCVKDYGVLDEWRGNPEGTRDYTQHPVKEGKDWKTLSVLDPSIGSLGGQLECVRLVKQGLPEETPLIQTVFDPLSQAKNLVGRDALLVHMRQHPEELLAGLETLTRSTIKFIEACLRIGIDGIFFAIQHAQSSLLSLEEYRKFVLPFDELILDQVSPLWLNVAHLHGKDLYFDHIPTRNIAVFNWHDRETYPSLSEAKMKFQGAVCGGLRQWETLVYGTPVEVTREVDDAIMSTQGERFILGTGCVVPIIAPHANILAARNSVDKDHQ